MGFAPYGDSKMNIGVYLSTGKWIFINAFTNGTMRWHQTVDDIESENDYGFCGLSNGDIIFNWVPASTKVAVMQFDELNGNY